MLGKKRPSWLVWKVANRGSAVLPQGSALLPLGLRGLRGRVFQAGGHAYGKYGKPVFLTGQVIAPAKWTKAI